MNLGELAGLAGMVGTVLPVAVSVINQPQWPKWARSVATLLVCLVAGTITAAAAGQLTGAGWPVAVIACATSALTTYHMWWKGSGVTTAVENATSPGARL